MKKHHPTAITTTSTSLKRAGGRGFTLIETVVAILILSVSLGALLTLSAGGIFSVRYARNQIVADNLNQEALEYFRNSRDTEAIRGTTWADWVASIPSGCFNPDGCSIDPYTELEKVKECDGDCPQIVFYPFSEGGFYGYENGQYPMSTLGVDPVVTTYIRTITMDLVTPDQLTINATIEWRNGSARKSVSQGMLLTSWNQ